MIFNTKKPIFNKKEKICKKKVAKKNYSGYIHPRFVIYACVAQLAEQLTLNQWVRGSNPRARTNKKTVALGGCFFMG